MILPHRSNIHTRSGIEFPPGYYFGFSRPLVAALAGSSIRRVVVVSSGGRGRGQNAGPIGVVHEVEELLEGTGVHLRALRCGMFMENMFREIAGGLHAADPRTPESTTPTTFEAWCGDTLKPAI